MDNVELFSVAFVLHAFWVERTKTLHSIGMQCMCQVRNVMLIIYIYKIYILGFLVQESLIIKTSRVKPQRINLIKTDKTSSAARKGQKKQQRRHIASCEGQTEELIYS